VLRANPAKMKPGAPEKTPEFDQIYAQHFAFVWRCLRGLGVPAQALDDAAQDVFVVVHRRLGEFRGESGVRTWLYGIVRNVASNQRRSDRRKGGLAELRELASAGPGPHEQAQDREAAQFVQQFLATASDDKRDVFVLALLEQIPMPEVAATLAIPLNTAYTRLRSVRLEFQRALARRGRS
jgi:RNA polymerase sigma-70 factor, ECF subfamily